MSIDPRDLKAPNPEQWDEYDKPRPLVPTGRYTGKAPEKFIFEADGDGFMRVVLDTIQLVDVPSGYKDQVRFERLSAKPREKGRLAGTSRLTDYLLATGTEPVRSEDPEEWARAVEQTAGALIEFFLDWRAYDSETQESLADTMTDFPIDPKTGEHQTWIANPKTGRRVPAQYRVRYFVRQRSR